MGKYNINELLEKKKELESQILEKGNVEVDDLRYVEEETIDYTNEKNNRTLKPKVKVSLIDFSQTFNGFVEELSKVKTAIQKYNSEKVLGRLQERESVRKKIVFLQAIKKRLPVEVKFGQKVSRQDKDGQTLEIVKVKQEPMFEMKDVEKQLNALSAQERKLNTEIQKLNLDASIEL